MLIGATAVVFVVTLLAVGAFYFGSRNRSEIKSVAVLPFVNTSGDPNTEYLSDGITESVINNLSQLRQLHVTARNTVFHYKSKDPDPQKVGQELQVRAIVTGRLVQRGDTLIIQTELVDTEKGSQLWGQQYNRKLSDVLALQEDISRQICENLRLHLTGEERQRLAQRYTDNAEAYQLYLKGKFYFNKRTKDGVLKSIDYFQQAIERDSTYAVAYTGLSEADALLAIYWFPPRDVMPKAKTAAQKALEIDPNLGQAYADLAYATFYYDWDWPEARRYYERAIALDPDNPMIHMLYGPFLNAQGTSDEGIRETRRAMELDPLSLPNNYALGLSYYYQRRYDEASTKPARASRWIRISRFRTTLLQGLIS
jgi:TolB-like protein